MAANNTLHVLTAQHDAHVTPTSRQQDIGKHTESLDEFLARTRVLGGDRIPTTSTCHNRVQVGGILRNMKGMSPKKVHEIERMAYLVDDVCSRTNADLVLDIGSGSVCSLARHRWLAGCFKSVH
jgi:hypothetical protein